VLGEAGYSPDEVAEMRAAWRGGRRRCRGRGRLSRHRRIAFHGRRGAAGFGQTARKVGPTSVGRVGLLAIGDQPFGIGILPAGQRCIGRGHYGADLGVLAGAIGLGALKLRAGDGDLGHGGRDRLRLGQRTIGRGVIALGRGAPRGRHQLERAGVLGAQFSGLPVVALAGAGAPALQIGPAVVGAIAAASIFDGALCLVILLALERRVDRREDQADAVLLLFGGNAATAEIGTRLVDLREARGGAIGQHELPFCLREVAAIGRLSRRGDEGTRLIDARLPGRRRPQLRQAAGTGAVLIVLIEALGIFGEQALDVPELLGRKGLVDGRIVLITLAIALVALGSHCRDLVACLDGLGEARNLLVGILQHRFGMREIADLGEATPFGNQPPRLRQTQLRIAIGPGFYELLLQRRPRRVAGIASGCIGEQAVGIGKVAGDDGPVDGRGEGNSVGVRRDRGRRSRSRLRRGRGREIGQDDPALLAGQLIADAVLGLGA
jgi:hypothetical protein